MLYNSQSVHNDDFVTNVTGDSHDAEADVNTDDDPESIRKAKLL